MKKVFRNINTMHEPTPSVHARNVITGSEVSSVSGTTNATSSTVHSAVDGWVSPVVVGLVDICLLCTDRRQESGVLFEIWFLG
ncbi:hypothetical protein Hanom_Chr11g01029271 [Helianthus anomalus]